MKKFILNKVGKLEPFVNKQEKEPEKTSVFALDKEKEEFSQNNPISKDIEPEEKSEEKSVSKKSQEEIENNSDNSLTEDSLESSFEELSEDKEVEEKTKSIEPSPPGIRSTDWRKLWVNY